MKKDKVLNDIKSLVYEIGKCADDIVKTGNSKDYKALLDTEAEMVRLAISAKQELTFLYDHIKVLYGLKDKADQVYFRANSLSADINSSEALRKAMNDYWHYVKLVVDKPINMDEP